jgi:hypothetical protein
MPVCGAGKSCCGSGIFAGGCRNLGGGWGKLDGGLNNSLCVDAKPAGGDKTRCMPTLRKSTFMRDTNFFQKKSVVLKILRVTKCKEAISLSVIHK